MELRAETDYPAPPEAVFALLCDEAFRSAVCEATHALSHHVEVGTSDGDVTVRTTRVMPAEVPDFVRRIVGETLTVEQAERWGPAEASGARSAGITVTVTGQPAGMTGSRRLEGTANGTHESVRGDVKVRVPFVGARIEPEIADAIKAAIRKEGDLARQWLADRP